MNLSLENFEGPIDVLYHLVQQCEIDIYEVKLQIVTEQFLNLLKQVPSSVDVGAEFIATAAALVWFKSKTLLPKDEQPIDEINEEEDPHFEIIHHLVEYCRFKEAAKDLIDRERQQKGYYSRGLVTPAELKRPLGIDHLTLEDLTALFKEIALKSSSQRGTLSGETWKLADKLSELRDWLALRNKIYFKEIFSFDKSRLELIVFFLAVLELMKLGEICAIRDEDDNIAIYLVVGQDTEHFSCLIS